VVSGAEEDRLEGGRERHQRFAHHLRVARYVTSKNQRVLKKLARACQPSTPLHVVLVVRVDVAHGEYARHWTIVVPDSFDGLGLEKRRLHARWRAL